MKVKKLLVTLFLLVTIICFNSLDNSYANYRILSKGLSLANRSGESFAQSKKQSGKIIVYLSKASAGGVAHFD